MATHARNNDDKMYSWINDHHVFSWYRLWDKSNLCNIKKGDLIHTSTWPISVVIRELKIYLATINDMWDSFVYVFLLLCIMVYKYKWQNLCNAYKIPSNTINIISYVYLLFIELLTVIFIRHVWCAYSWEAAEHAMISNGKYEEGENIGNDIRSIYLTMDDRVSG